MTHSWADALTVQGILAALHLLWQYWTGTASAQHSRTHMHQTDNVHSSHNHDSQRFTPFGHELDVLDRVRRLEAAAVGVYDRCLRRLDHNVRVELRPLRESHETRREQLREQMVALGGAPTEVSAFLGTLAQWAGGAVARLGTVPTLRMLELGELHGVRQYHCIGGVEPETRELLRMLRPEQDATYEKVGELARIVA